MNGGTWAAARKLKDLRAARASGARATPSPHARCRPYILCLFFDTVVTPMLDLNFVRDNLPLVEEKLRLRGMDPGEVLKDFREVDTSAAPGHHRSRDHQSAAQPRLRRNREAEKERAGRDCADGRNQGIARADSASWRKRQRTRNTSAGNSGRHSEPAARKRAGRQNRRRQRRSPALGHAAEIRFHAQAALGTGRSNSAFSISNAPPNFPARASPCTGTWAPGWSARSPTSCSTCTPASTATPKCCRRIW